jgi:hypothetical protein
MLPAEILDELMSENSLADVQSDNRLKQLTAAINDLINHDFGKLVQLLYRVDVSEILLKKMLQDHPTVDAAGLIAALLVERQVQKLQAKQKWKGGETDIPEEEKW